LIRNRGCIVSKSSATSFSSTASRGVCIGSRE
jgi:hypothetical protein